MEPEDLKPGAKLNLHSDNCYEVLQCVYPLNKVTGRGLYRIKDTDTHLEFALKVFDLGLNDARELRREMVALNQRNTYPTNIPRCQQFAELGNKWAFLRLDWLNGATLTQSFARPPVDIHELSLRIAVIKELCGTAELLHKNNLLHRDLKPDNVLLRDPKQPKSGLMLIDLGLSTQRRVNTEGTSGYQAPEQSGSRAFNLTVAVDIYAIGQIAWWLLSGSPRIAYPDPEYKDWDPVGMQILTQVQPLASPHLSSILERAMSYDPKKRFRTVRDFRHELERIRG